MPISFVSVVRIGTVGQGSKIFCIPTEVVEINGIEIKLTASITAVTKKNRRKLTKKIPSARADKRIYIYIYLDISINQPRLFRGEQCTSRCRRPVLTVKTIVDRKTRTVENKSSNQS